MSTETLREQLRNFNQRVEDAQQSRDEFVLWLQHHRGWLREEVEPFGTPPVGDRWFRNRFFEVSGWDGPWEEWLCPPEETEE